MIRPWLTVLQATLAVTLCGGCPGVLPDGLPGPQGGVSNTELRSKLAEHGVTATVAPSVDSKKAVLGQALFFDKILSGNRNISCSTCHTPLAFTSDGLSLSIGQGGSGVAASRLAPVDANGSAILIPRNAPDVFNRSGFRTMFWDARVSDQGDGSFDTPAGEELLPGLDSVLAAQAMFPVTSRDEMRGFMGDNELADIEDNNFRQIWSALMSRLLAIEEYRQMFAAAYPNTSEENLTFVHAANAIAAFELNHWTLDDSPFDDYLRGDDSALSDTAKRGALLFYGEARCADCHTGALLTDQLFHNRCAPQLGPGKGNGADGTRDFGRENITGDEADRYKFRTPPLRNVAATGPWMHSGAFTSLEAVVRHELDPVNAAATYDPGQLSPIFAEVYHGEQTEDMTARIDPAGAVPIVLSDDEVSDLVNFLESLTSRSIGSLAIDDTPDSVPSGLPLAD